MNGVRGRPPRVVRRPGHGDSGWCAGIRGAGSGPQIMGGGAAVSPRVVLGSWRARISRWEAGGGSTA